MPAPATTLSTDLIVGAAPLERAGSASAISETGGELGNALGIAVLGSIGIAVYRGAMADGVPGDVPPAAAEAARDTLGGAVGAADQLPAGVLQAAGEAFTHGFQVSAGLTAGLALAVAAATAVIMRRRGGRGAEPALAPGAAPAEC